MSFGAATPPFAPTTKPFASPNRCDFDVAVDSSSGGLFTIDAAFLETYFAGFPRPPANLLRLFSQNYSSEDAAGDALRPIEYSAVASIASGNNGQPPARRLAWDSATKKAQFVLSSGNVDGQWRVTLRLPVSQVG